MTPELSIQQDEPPAAADRVLAVSMGGLGDTVLFSPVFRAVRARYPHAFVEFLASSRLCADVYEDTPEINKCTVADTNRCCLPFKLLALLPSVFRWRKEGGFDVAVFATGLNRGLAKFLGNAASIRCVMLAPTVPDYPRDLECNVALARCLDPGIAEGAAFVPVSGEERRAIERVLAQHRIVPGRDRIMAVYPSRESGWRSRRWPVERLLQVAGELKRGGAVTRVVVVGGDVEGREWSAHDTKGIADANLAGVLSIRSSIALLSCSCLVLGNDGGIMHAAGTLRLPVVDTAVGIPEMYRPPGRRTVMMFSPASAEQRDDDVAAVTRVCLDVMRTSPEEGTGDRA